MQIRRVTGQLRLRFTWHPTMPHTRLTVGAQQPPLRVVRAFHLGDGTALTHLHNLSGGVLGGDHLEFDIEVGPCARAQLTSTGATRVYRHRAGMPDAVQRMQVQVGADALLEYLPDPLIPFAGARYRQATRINLAPGAGLFWWELVAPGRDARAEIFAFERLQTTLDLTAEGRPLALERACLEPQIRPLTSLVRFGPYRHMATFYICRVGLEPDRWLALEAQLNNMADQMSQPGEILWGVSTLPAHGLVVRALSSSGRALPGGLVQFWRIARRELYGQEPVLPRKVY